MLMKGLRRLFFFFNKSFALYRASRDAGMHLTVLIIPIYEAVVVSNQWKCSNNSSLCHTKGSPNDSGSKAPFMTYYYNAACTDHK